MEKMDFSAIIEFAFFMDLKSTIFALRFGYSI